MGQKPAIQTPKETVKLPQTINTDAIPKVCVSIPKPSPSNVTEKAIDCVKTLVKPDEDKLPKPTEKHVEEVKIVQENVVEKIATEEIQAKLIETEVNPIKMDINLVRIEKI